MSSTRNFNISPEPAICARLEPIIQALKVAEHKSRTIIAIDGPCGSGKTTLARLLTQMLDASCVHMDDFHVPHALKTPQRMALPGGNSDRERLLKEVVLPWKNGQTVAYQPYDCGADTLLSPVNLPDSKILILEGSYSHHPEIRAYIDIQVFVRVEREEQLRRIETRCAEKLPMFISRWIPLEQQYFDAFQLPTPQAIVIQNDSVADI